jgi:hypothetical protein
MTKDCLISAPGPCHQHSDQDTHAESDADCLIGMFADDFVGGPGGGDGLFLQTLTSEFGLLDGGFQSCPKFTLLIVYTFSCFHSLFLS